MPDVAIIPELCKILNITINDLFSGEIVDKKSYEKKLEENLLEVTKKKEEADKQLLKLEIVIGYISSISFLILIFIASYITMSLFLRIFLIVISLIIFFIGMFYALKIEQIAGFYRCSKCNYKYIPEYKDVFFAMHINRTRYLKCPKCGKRSWNKKVIK